MPHCEGLPSGPCPLKTNDLLVVLGKGDLMLCLACDTERCLLFDESALVLLVPLVLLQSLPVLLTMMSRPLLPTWQKWLVLVRQFYDHVSQNL